MKRPIDLHASGWQEPLLEALYWVFVVCGVGLIIVGVSVGWWLVSLLGGIGVGVLVYGGFIEPQLVQTTHYALGEGEKKLRVVFLSDFHAGVKKQQSFYKKIAKQVIALQSDIVLLGGDFVDESAKAVDALAPILELRPALGAWFVLGNHDFWDDPKRLVASLTKYGARDLTNHALQLKLTTADSLEIVGLDDSSFGSPNLRLVQVPKKGLRIIVMHEPDLLVDLPEGCADLVLLGHTHGGQIRLPGYGAVLGVPQRISQSLDVGEKTWNGLRVIISRGIGEAGVRARLGVRPEIVVVDVHAPTMPVDVTDGEKS